MLVVTEDVATSAIELFKEVRCTIAKSAKARPRTEAEWEARAARGGRKGRSAARLLAEVWAEREREAAAYYDEHAWDYR